MTEYKPMQVMPDEPGYGAGDVLVLIGELFGRGYANGMVVEAKRLGMTVIGTTVGRRDSDGTLRPLLPEELKEAEALLGGRIINIPLEAGFDMEAVDGQPSLIEQMRKTDPADMQLTNVSESFIENARDSGTARFRKAIARLASELLSVIPVGVNVVCAHIMAGGIPRARMVMPFLNRVFKGIGGPFMSSEAFSKSRLGQICNFGFNEVSAETFSYFIEETTSLRERVKSAGTNIAYIAYGYHGTGVLVGGMYRWQSYTPYLPGGAKIRLENIAADAFTKGITATVFNCPEIQTNSSALFIGCELSLYPLLTSIRQIAGNSAVTPLYERCQLMLKDGETLENLLERANIYLESPVIAKLFDFNKWPLHNTPEQSESTLASSAELFAMQRDQKKIVSAELSRIVFLATGCLMLHASRNPGAATLWLNHDIIASLLSSNSFRSRILPY